MDFLISNAWAQAASGGGQTDLFGFLPLILIFVVFYFLLIRPQSKRQKEHKKMLAELEKGNEVVTNGGLYGKIAEIGDTFLLLDVADGVQVKVHRSMIQSLMPKGSGKTL